MLRGEAEATGRKPPRGTRSSAIPRHPLLTGEGKAHAEVTERYGVRFRCVCGPCGPMPRPRLLARDAWRAYFVVEAIGHPKPRAGYVLSEEDAAAFTAANALCVERRGKFETFLSNGTAR